MYVYVVTLTSRQHEEVVVAPLYQCGGSVVCQSLILVIDDDDLAWFVLLFTKLSEQTTANHLHIRA